ncbi:MAG TPA: MFS transporter [Ignavibacteria bacterium]|nr:MFS transporter [Ignavibacteria bacterium]
MNKNKSAFIVIFLTVFIDLLGFGIIIPLLPDFLKNQMHEPESMIGVVVGIFSLMQFIFTPVWGSFSDIYGRKNILIISLAGNVISYLMMTLVFSGIVPSIILLITSRAFAGIFSGNIAAAQSTISDITTIENRSKGMGIIGAAFGLGFLFGPALGGFLSVKFGYGIPILLSSVFSFIALMLCISIFKETLPEDIKAHNKKNFKGVTIINFRAVHDVLRNKKVGIYVIIFFFITFSFANIHATFLLFVERPEGLHLGTDWTSYLLSYMGIIAALVQGVLIKFFKKSIGEEKSVLIGNILTMFGLFSIPFCTSIPQMLLTLTVLAFGNGLNNPMVLGLISMNVSRQEQGSVLGITQALGSLARFFGPLWGGFVYQYLGYHAPFISGAVFMAVITLFGLSYLLKRSPVTAEDQ